jgi:site-specific DNA recombinase
MSPAKGTRLVGYIRVSRVAGRSGESFISPDVQREQIEQYAKAKGAKIVATFTDLDESGGKVSRPEFDKALELIESGEADGLIVAHLDRFMRSLSHGLDVIQRLEQNGKQLIAVDNHFDDTPTGRFVRNLFLGLAQMERERIAEKWQTASGRALSRGVPPGQPPFGYRRDGEGRFEPDPATAPLVVQLFKRRAAGESWRSLCDWLDGEHPSPTGGHWTIQTLSYLIQRRTYRGEVQGGAEAGYPGHEPLVTEAEWVAAQGQKLRHARTSNGHALLAGLLRCGSCGGLMTRRSDGKRGYTNYECSGRNGTTGKCTRRAKISERQADAHVQAFMLAHADPEFVVTWDDSADHSQAEAEHQAALTELQAYVQHVPATTPGFAEGLATRQAALDQAAEELQRLASSGPASGEANAIQAWLGTADNLDPLSKEAKRKALAYVIDHIEVQPNPTAGTGAKAPTGPRPSAAERMTIHWRTSVTAA